MQTKLKNITLFIYKVGKYYYLTKFRLYAVIYTVLHFIFKLHFEPRMNILGIIGRLYFRWLRT